MSGYQEDNRAERADRPPAEVAQQEPGRPRRRRFARLTAMISGLALALALAVGAPLAASGRIASTAGTGDDAVVSGGTWSGRSGWQGPGQDSTGQSGQSDSGQSASGQSGQSDSGQSDSGQSGQSDATQSQSEAVTATSKESTGVVTISTTLSYADESAAGTGMVLTSNGTVLTNNHVVEGATGITVTVPSTGKTYAATVVGTDTSEDIAVLKLTGSSGLATVKEDQDTESVGQNVTAVGNAEGQGTLMAASGVITALNSTVTTSAEGTVGSESLDDMIQISADVVSGDSGGALLDTDGEVVGMTTAASSGTSDVVAYAIPIENALKVVSQIESGKEGGGVTLGYPAFLGVEVASGTSTTSSAAGEDGQQEQGAGSSTVSGAQVAEVIDGTPAAEAGLSAGDTITAIGGTTISSATGLSEALAGYRPGSKVTVAWTDADGASHTASVTLTTGPAA